ncbi:hypothetical protein Tsubulata_035583 [Turnera subulata]|uniref:CCHC-type domain-containing protein n=1 Tax=Turnera subulata TaxID=218843 RepID=A0A9Q0FX23_9ROSI|nr:hypothetical protein Tsubulata_035583 [Turnera subulata]
MFHSWRDRQEVELVEAPVWVQIYDIPLNQRTSSNVQDIANKTGRFIRFDEKGAAGWGKFVRVKVALNVEKPLRKMLSIRKSQGPSTGVSYRYEGIPNFCYLCGKLGHLIKECDRRNEESNEEEVLNYGEWMRATPWKPYSAKLEALEVKPNTRAQDDASSKASASTSQGVSLKLQVYKDSLELHTERALNLSPHLDGPMLLPTVVDKTPEAVVNNLLAPILILDTPNAVDRVCPPHVEPSPNVQQSNSPNTRPQNFVLGSAGKKEHRKERARGQSGKTQVWYDEQGEQTNKSHRAKVVTSENASTDRGSQFTPEPTKNRLVNLLTRAKPEQ